jgi:hypothetical protein
MLIQTNQRAVLRTRLVAIIVPVAASAPLAVTHIIIAVTHIVIPEARVVQLDMDILSSINLQYFFYLSKVSTK